MHYKKLNIIVLFALVLSFATSKSNIVQAQGVVKLQESISNQDDVDSIPDEISLFGDDDTIDISQEDIDDTAGIIPQASSDMPNISNETSDMSKDNSEEIIVVEEVQDTNSSPLNLSSDENNYTDSNSSVNTNDDLFLQMSDIEKQTALLSLELRREKIKNEIKAMKLVRTEADNKAKDKVEEKIKKQIEWEKEQEAKIIKEQQKLRSLDIKFEKQRQERILKSYKNDLLKNQYEWVNTYSKLFNKIAQEKDAKQVLLSDVETKFTKIVTATVNAEKVAIKAKKHQDKIISDLETQISILKARIEAQERERERLNKTSAKNNPFANDSKTMINNQVKLNNIYAIMEIKGQGGELVAKLINKDGMPFLVKQGTILQTGHAIEEITTDYIRATHKGINDYLYFAASGALDREPVNSIAIKNKTDKVAATPAPTQAIPRSFMSSAGVPGLGTDMIIR